MSAPAVTDSAACHPSAPPAAAEIDASFRLPVFCLGLKAVLWLILGSGLLLLASIKLHGPGMLSATGWLTYGRLQPAGWDVLVYGFAGQGAVLAGLWVLARAARQRLQVPAFVIAGGLLWNLGVLGTLVGILCGWTTGRELLEMPPGALACLVIAGALFGVSGWMTFAARHEVRAYPSAWFVLLALLTFVWVGSVALAMLSGEGSRGVVQVLVQRWFAGGVLRLWLGGFTVALILHRLPTLVDRPLASRQLTLIAFWCLAFFAPWAVTRHGDPFPRWLVSAGLAGNYLATIACLALALNWLKTVEGAWQRLFQTTAGRFTGAAAIAYVAAGTLQFLTALEDVSAITRLTWTEAGADWLLAGAAVLAVFGVLPELVARAFGRPLEPGLLSAHAWLTLVGLGLAGLPLLPAGLVFGSQLGGGTASFVDALRASMHLVRLNSLGLLIFLAGQFVLLAAVLRLIRELAGQGVRTVMSWSIPVSGGKAAGVRS